MTRRNIRLSTLVEQVFGGNVPPMPPGKEKDEPRPTTIRPSAEVAHYYQYHADRLSISLQDVMMLALKAVAESSLRETEHTFQLAIDRFKTIFEEHKIPQIHAKSVLEASGQIKFPLGALTNDTMLLEAYTPSLKNEISEIFHVRGSWLAGEENTAVITDPIYGRDHAFDVWDRATRVTNTGELKQENCEFLAVKSDRQAIGFTDDDSKNSSVREMLLYTVRTIRIDKHMAFKTYELNGIFPTLNIEARSAVQALLQVAQKEDSNVGCQGISVNHDDYSSLKSGKLPATYLNNGFHTNWDLSDLTSNEMVTGAETLADLLRLNNG